MLRQEKREMQREREREGRDKVNTREVCLYVGWSSTMTVGMERDSIGRGEHIYKWR